VVDGSRMRTKREGRGVGRTGYYKNRGNGVGGRNEVHWGCVGGEQVEREGGRKSRVGGAGGLMVRNVGVVEAKEGGGGDELMCRLARGSRKGAKDVKIRCMEWVLLGGGW